MSHLPVVLTAGLLTVFALGRSSVVGQGAAVPSAMTRAAASGESPAIIRAGSANPWWECPLQSTLQQNGQLVRCFAPGKVTDVVPSCGVGHALVMNLSGNRDRCRNLSGGLLDYTCPISYSAVVLTGQDVCRHKAPDAYHPPMRPAGGLY